MRNFIKAQDIVMLSNYSIAQVSGIKAYMKGTIQLPGLFEGRYPLICLGDWHYDTEGNHFVEGLLYLVSVLNGYLPPDVLDRGMDGSVQMV